MMMPSLLSFARPFLLSGALLAALVLLNPLSAGAGESAECVAEPATAPAQHAFTAEEVADLVRQYQEEVMSRRFYEAFAGKWGLRPFTNIASRGETMHAKMLHDLLTQAGFGDLLPEMAGDAFPHPEVQKAFDRLLAQGTASLEGAIRAGLENEELDIKELRAQRAAAANPDVVRLYEILEMGSSHHLQAFSRQARMRGIDYAPKHLTPEEFDAVVTGIATPPTEAPAPATTVTPGGAGCGQRTESCCGGACRGAGRGKSLPASQQATEPKPAGCGNGPGRGCS